MGRQITYEADKIPQLEKRLKAMQEQMNNIGYGSRAIAARWLMEQQYQKGDPTKQKDINRVAKKVAHILKGYVRGIHPTMYDGGVWSAAEAEFVVEMLEIWLSVREPVKVEQFSRCPRTAVVAVEEQEEELF
jgi:hypothetical protein